MNLDNKESAPLPNLRGMKIARISSVAFALDQVYSQIVALAQNQALVTIVCTSEATKPRSGTVPAVSFLPIAIARSISPIRDLFAVYHLWRIFRSNRFDIVHSTTPKAGLLVAIASRLAGVPVRLHTFTGQVWATRTGIARKLLKLCDSAVVKLSTATYADSKSQIAFLEAERVAPVGKVRVLGSGSISGVDTQRFSPERFSESDKVAIRAELAIPAGAKVLIFVGRLHIDKGLRELRAAFEQSAATHPDLHLIMVGPNEDDSKVFDVIRSMPDLGARVHLVGAVTNPERYLSVSDILCLPSYREGFGTVVLEAASMGIPTIASNIYGLSDAVVDGETGLLVKVGDVDSLTVAIDELLNEANGLRKKLGASARTRVLREFDARVVSELVLQEYRTLLRT